MPAQTRSFLEALDEVSDAVESGAGLPAVARAAGRALDASVIVLDAGSSVLAVACASPEDERAVMAGEAGTETVALRVAEAEVGQPALPAARRAAAGRPPATRGEPDRAGAGALAGTGASDRGGGRRLPPGPARAPRDRPREHRGARDGAGLRPRGRRHGDRGARAAAGTRGGRLARPRAHPRRARRAGDRARLAGGAGGGGMVAPRRQRSERGRRAARPARARDPGARRRPSHRPPRAPPRSCTSWRRACRASCSRWRAAATRPSRRTSTERAPRPCSRRTWRRRAACQSCPSRRPAPTGCCCRRWPRIPRELQGFFDETVAPLVTYDEQYETELVRTLETFLDADGNVARTSEKLFTHRHTIRYRLERVKELTDARRLLHRRPRTPLTGPEGNASPRA